MPLACNVHKQHHVMVGVDFHDALTPAPVPCMPHLVGAMLRAGPWGSIMSGQWSSTCLTEHGNETMAIQTDIGSLIPHVPLGPDLLWVLDTLFSSSKSEFGVSSVEMGWIKGNPASKAAVAVAPMVALGVNLNCHGPTLPPMPFPNIVFAWNTHQAGFTMQDLTIGLTHLVADAFVQFVVNRLFGGGFGNFGTKLLNKLFGEAVDNLAAKAINALVARFGKGTVAKFLGRTAAETIAALPSNLVTTLIGTPLGISVPGAPSASAPLVSFVESLIQNANIETLAAPLRLPAVPNLAPANP